MRKTFKLFIALPILLSLISCEHSPVRDISPISSFSEVDFAEVPEHSLAIFDVDETLIQSIDAYLIKEHSDKGKRFKQKFISDNPTVKEWDALVSTMVLTAERPLIEPDIFNKISLLHKRNIPVIALSGMNTGRIGTIKNLEEWRYNHLRSLGFEGSFRKHIIPIKGFTRHPIFCKGILATDLEEKGPVLGKFLDAMHLNPSHIIMFDDDLDYLRSVKNECSKRHIPFQGYHYQGFKSKEWDEELIHFQAPYLVKNNVWLSDKDAKILLTTKAEIEDTNSNSPRYK